MHIENVFQSRAQYMHETNMFCKIIILGLALPLLRRRLCTTLDAVPFPNSFAGTTVTR
jgi:hypothetical protein